MSIAATPVLRVRNACKRFGAVVALDGVSLDVAPGEVLALLGDNGAGKSTLIKAISGVHRLDEGTVTLDGLDITAANAMTVRSHGVETVYQDLALFDNLAPPANFFAGREVAEPSWLPRGLRLLRHRTMTESTTSWVTGSHPDLRRHVVQGDHGRLGQPAPSIVTTA